ncbi:MAG: peptide chain release factor 2 [Armatimonadota bacterium]
MQRYAKWGIVFDLAQKKATLKDLKESSEETGFWDNPNAAQNHMKKIADLERYLEPWEDIEEELEDLQVLAELAIEESEESLENEIKTGLADIENTLGKLRMQALLGGKYDDNPAILSINAGAGGTEACDWAAILLRMYQRWAERQGHEFNTVSTVAGDSAGIRNATAFVDGDQAYGRLRAEAGVHRLVRISPFDSSKRRHTSFASVDVIPQTEEEEEVEIDPNDLRVDTYRASGAGGQHVNKTDSAVRITHIPTNTVVQCQNERSQIANRRTAMQLLKSRLAEIERRKKQEEVQALRGEKSGIDFGSQIRSYVMQPYTMVKDHRTNVEVSQVEAVLDGEIDQFIAAYLQMMAGKGEDNEED